MTKSQHKRTAVASMFQNGISRNTKCAVRDGFRRDSHIFYFTKSFVIIIAYEIIHIGTKCSMRFLTSAILSIVVIKNNKKVYELWHNFSNNGYNTEHSGLHF